MNYTSVEQSKELLKLGLSPESADMYYNFDVDIKTGELYFPADGSSIMVRRNDEPLNLNLAIPCWSVGALLDVMPETIKTCEIWNPDDSKKFLLKLGKGWIIYECFDLGFDPLVYFNADITGSFSILDNCYNMVVWLLENNYIKNN